MKEIETKSENKELPKQMPSTHTKEAGMRAMETRLENRMREGWKNIPTVVSKEQFESVATAHKNSVNLLDSCGLALLDAMEMAIPPRDSGRQVGEYTGQNLRQMAKSVCDIVQTKTNVVRSMYQITRDEL